MADARQVAEGFFDAWTGKDFERAKKRKVFVDGDDVCVICDLKTAPVPSSRTCEWYQVRDGRIASVSVVFDARPFAPLLGRSTAPEPGRRGGSSADDGDF
jgi:hypothetical protein